MLRAKPASGEPAIHDDRDRAVKLAADADNRTPTVPAVDTVDASGADSFPASDPPSWWSGR